MNPVSPAATAPLKLNIDAPHPYYQQQGETHTAGAQSVHPEGSFPMTAGPVYGHFPVFVPCSIECKKLFIFLVSGSSDAEMPYVVEGTMVRTSPAGLCPEALAVCGWNFSHLAWGR